MEVYNKLGNNWQRLDEIFDIIQQYICHQYESLKKELVLSLYGTFPEKYQNNYRLVDMSTLPPWKRAILPKQELPRMRDFDRDQNSNIVWLDEKYQNNNVDTFLIAIMTRKTFSTKKSKVVMRTLMIDFLIFIFVKNY